MRLILRNAGGLSAIVLCLSVIALSGCAASPEFRREIMGIKAADIENAAKKYIQTAPEPPDEVFDRVLANIRRMGAETRSVDRKTYCIVAYRFEKKFKACIDTTMVGILLKRAPDGRTEVTVASDNWHLGAFVSSIILEIPKPAQEERAVSGAMTTAAVPAPAAAAPPTEEKTARPVLVEASQEARQVASGAIDIVTGVMTTAVAPFTGSAPAER